MLRTTYLLALLVGIGQISCGQAGESLADLAEQMDWSQMASVLADPTYSAVDQAQPDGMTALHWSVWHDHLPTVQLLLDQGASPQTPNRYGVVPLMSACTNGNAAIVKLLLNHGANASVQTQDGQSVLMTAARTGRLDCVNLLLEHGTDVLAKERKGQTALMWAAHEGHADVVEVLIKAGGDFRSALPSGFTPLHFAARQGCISAVETLIKAGADVNQPFQRGKNSGGKAPRNASSPLILAVENGHFDLAARLIELGADPNDQRSGYSPLHMLSWVRKPNRGDGDDGDPPPTGSGRMTSLEFARFAVGHGANVNIQLDKGPSGRGQLNHTGATPLLMAAHTDDLPYVKLLVELGADVQINNADRCTPLLAAAGIGVLAPGEEAGTEEEAIATVAYLYELGLSVNAVDNNAETAMHAAAYKSLPRMVQWLSQHGADRHIWNRQNKYGWTPLSIAQGHRPGNFKPNEEVQQALQQCLTDNSTAP